MAKKDRLGIRKTREQRSTRVPELGYYLVVTDTEGTERCYFNGLRDSLPESVKGRLVVKVFETETTNLVEKCKEQRKYDPQYRKPWIVFDRDQVKDFDSIIREAEKSGIDVGWSNPCFEIWLYAYYDKMPIIYNSWDCCSKFGALYASKTGIDYDKADENIYSNLIRFGDESKAITIAERSYEQRKESGCKLPSEMWPCTKVHRLIKEIRGKIPTV